MANPRTRQFQLFYLCVKRDRLARRDVDVVLQRTGATADFDLVRAGLQVEALERSVVVVDDAGVRAVQIDLGVLSRARDADAAVRPVSRHYVSVGSIGNVR